MLRPLDFRCNTRMLNYVAELFSMVGQTKVVEDGMHYERRGEGEADSLIMGHLRRWLCLIEAQILGRIHRYDEVDWKSESVARGFTEDMIKGLLVSDKKQHSPVLNFRGIIGKSSANPPWYSPAPASEPRQQADLQTALYCLRHGCWDKAKHTWLANLATDDMLLKHPSFGDQWFFALGDAGGSGTAVIGWPARELQNPNGDKFYVLKSDVTHSAIRFLIVLSLDGWQVMRYLWQSPAALRSYDVAEVPCAAKPTSGPEPLLEAAARGAFQGLELTAVKKLAAHVGCVLTQPTTLFDAVWALMRHAFPLYGEDTLWEFMQTRWQSRGFVETVLDDGILDQVGEKDAKEAHGCQLQPSLNVCHPGAPQGVILKAM